VCLASELREIGALVFEHCPSLQSLFIPSFVQTIDGSSFCNSDIREIVVSPANCRFKVRDPFLLNHDGTEVIRYFGRDSCLEIFREVRILCRNAFSGCDTVQTVTFEPDSKLHRIESNAFSRCASLRWICIPSSVDIIDGIDLAKNQIHQITVAADNPLFRVSDDFLLNHDGTSLLQYFGSDSTITIPREITVSGRNLFRYHFGLRRVTFLPGSGLRRIESGAFGSCALLCSIFIPSFVDTISGSAFGSPNILEIAVARDNRHFTVRDHFLPTSDGTSLIRYFGTNSEVIIIQEIVVLCPGSFANCMAVWNVNFEDRAAVQRIQSKVFSECVHLRSISIPSGLDTIDGSAFSGSGLRHMSVSEDNRHFKVSGDFLLDRAGLCLICYFGDESTVTICREIEVLSEDSFCSCESLRRVKFESESSLRSIEARVFEKCFSLRFGSLPSSTQILGHRCFAKCQNLRQVEFGPKSKLTRIEAESFARCSVLDQISLPLSLKDNADVDLSGVNGLEVEWYDDST
jgi:hypothetical protein